MNNPSIVLMHEKTPVELSAEILRYIKQHVESVLGQEVKKAVITVPAYFDDTARQATKDAATLAGLSVLRLINEPTAAALSYGLDQSAEGLYVIYDFGGGTFDVSLLKMSMGIFQVLATSGDVELGGDDIDQAIANYWHQDKGISLDKNLTRLARKAKESLANQVNWQETFSGQILELNQEKLNEIVKPFVQKTLSICWGIFIDANIDISDVKGVVLVGGSTRLQEIRSAVRTFFKKEPLINLDPDQIVALGAALQADALSHGSETLLLDVTSLSLGIETMGGLVEKIIPRNTPVPTAIAQEFTTYQDGQTAMKIHVVQGERELVSGCRSLAEFVLTDIPPMVAGAARIQVTFEVDADGVLTVSALEKTTETFQKITVKPSYGLNHEDLERMIQEGFEKGTEDIQKRLLIEVEVEAKQLLHSLKVAIEADSDLLSNEEKEILENKANYLKSILSQNDREMIRKQIKDLSILSQSFAERRISRSIQKRLMGKPVI
jgi:molecular chaperone HscA